MALSLILIIRLRYVFCMSSRRGYMIHCRSRFSVFVSVLFLATALPSLSRADVASSRPALEPAQLDAFAALVGEPTNRVAQRLSNDPGVVPLAATAAEVRLRRKHTGKVLAIAGFTVFGVGTAIDSNGFISPCQKTVPEDARPMPH